VLPGQQYLPEDILRILWRRKWFVIIPFIAATLGATMVAQRMPNRYRSETVILVVPQRVPEGYVRATVTARIEDRLSSIQQEILSRSRLERVIEDFNLYPEERKTDKMEEIVSLMREDIEGPTIERGDAFRVAYISHSPKLAQQVTDRLASLFIQENLHDRKVQAQSTNEFLDGQLADAHAQLKQREAKLEAYRRRHAGELPDQVEGNLQAIRTAQAQLQVLSDAINRDTDRRLNLEGQIADLELGEPIPAPVGTTPLAEPAPGVTTEEQLEGAIAKLRALQLRYKPDHPDIGVQNRTIRDLRARLEIESKNRPTLPDAPAVSPGTTSLEVSRRNRLRSLQTEVKNIEAQVAKRQAESQRLQASIEVYQARVDAAPTRQTELTELTRDYTTLEAAYKSLLNKREDSRVAANLERQQISEQFKVLDAAHFPERPFGPNRLKIEGAGAVFGLFIGVALVVLLEYLDSSFKTDGDVHRVLQIPVLALIPIMKSEREQRQQRRRKLLVGVAATVFFVGSVGAYAAWKLQAF
jgi:polysaccharide chain length determinant protein (PEP-CTERM system associated)